MSTGFVKATKSQSKARIALDGPSGSGKTWTGLTTAVALAAGGKVAVIDSERGSASKYAGDFDFDVMELAGNFHPDNYVRGLNEAARAGYAVCLIDSMSHAWNGPGGVLEIVDGAKSRFGGNSWSAWSVGTPIWQAFIDAILASPMHVVVTLRSKTKWLETEDEKGRKKYSRVGTEPQARDGVEFEFDVIGDLDLDHTLVVAKTRCTALDGRVFRRPDGEFGQAILAWLTDGAPVEAPLTGDDLVAYVAELVADDRRIHEPLTKAEAREALKAAGLGRKALAEDKDACREAVRQASIRKAGEAALGAAPAAGEEVGEPTTSGIPPAPAATKSNGSPGAGDGPVAGDAAGGGAAITPAGGEKPPVWRGDPEDHDPGAEAQIPGQEALA